MSMSDEVEPIRTESSDPRRLAADSRDSNGPSLRSQSLISMAASQVSSFETVSLSERCKTLDIELSDLRDRYVGDMMVCQGYCYLASLITVMCYIRFINCGDVFYFISLIYFIM